MATVAGTLEKKSEFLKNWNSRVVTLTPAVDYRSCAQLLWRGGSQPGVMEIDGHCSAVIHDGVLILRSGDKEACFRNGAESEGPAVEKWLEAIDAARKGAIEAQKRSLPVSDPAPKEELPAEEVADRVRMTRRSLDERLNMMMPLPDRKTSVVQRLSQFTSGMVTAMTVVQAQKQTLMDEGMTAPKYAFGVINTITTAFLLGKYPEYYWIYFGVQATVLLTIRTVTWWRQRLQFYLLDFCWLFNYLLCAVTLVAVFEFVGSPRLAALLDVTLPPLSSMLPAEVHRLGWPIIFTISTGPLTWAVAATGNSLVFHSFEHTAAMFIHASPMLSAWAIRWHGEEIDAAFPGLLGAPPSQPDALHDLFLPSAGYYFCWWLPYTVWLATDGLGRADKGYDTVFANFAPVVMGQLGISSPRCAAISYMQFHALGSTLTLAIAALAYHHYLVHTVLILLMLLSAVLSGAKVYAYYMLDLYEEKLRERMGSRSDLV